MTQLSSNLATNRPQPTPLKRTPVSPGFVGYAKELGLNAAQALAAARTDAVRGLATTPACPRKG
jgi:hypothetical protein